jgi:Glycosyl hydrolase family 76
MPLSFDHRLALGALGGSLLACALGSVCWASVAFGAPSRPPGSGPARYAAGASGYPAGTSRPSVRARPSEFARPPVSARPAANGGAVAPGSSKRPKKEARKPVLHGNPKRALVAFRAMQKAYYIKGKGLYAGEPYSYLWPFSQALAATVSMANVPHLGVSFARELHARLIGLGSYWDTDNSGAPEGTFTSTLPGFDGAVVPPAGPGGTKYYDDNDWIGIELLRIYKLTRSASVLGSAEAIMAFEIAAWQASPELGCPGGLPFSNAAGNSERNTVTGAPAAELATQLYRITHNAQYLQFAEMAYEWVRRCLLAPSGLYADHVNRKGVVEPHLWSYNQGTMIGAGTLLYQATHNSAYLYQARQTAKAALAYFTPERLGSEIPFFPSIYFRNLLYLDSVTHDPPGPRIAQAYVNYAWEHLRLRNDVFVAGSPASAQLLVQAAIVQIYALLSSAPSTYF